MPWETPEFENTKSSQNNFWKPFEFKIVLRLLNIVS